MDSTYQINLTGSRLTVEGGAKDLPPKQGQQYEQQDVQSTALGIEWPRGPHAENETEDHQDPEQEAV